MRYIFAYKVAPSVSCFLMKRAASETQYHWKRLLPDNISLSFNIDFSHVCCCRNNLSLHCTFAWGMHFLYWILFSYLDSLVLTYFFFLRPRSNTVFKVLKLNISAYFGHAFSAVFLTVTQMSLDSIIPQVTFIIQP